MGGGAIPGSALVAWGTSTVRSSSHSSGQLIPQRVGAARRVLVEGLVGSSVPKHAPPYHAGAGAHGDDGATRVAVLTFDEAVLANRPVGRWMAATLPIVGDAMVSARWKGVPALLVTISACPQVPSAAALRRIQPCVVMMIGPSLDLSGGDGGGGHEAGGAWAWAP